MTWSSFWNGFKKVVSAPFKLVANVGKTVYNKVIKPVANFGSNAVKSVANFVKDSANTVLHMPEKVLHSFDHGIDTAGNTLQGLFKSPMMLLLGVGAVVLLPSLMKMK
jgi:phage-related protein